ncbi:hypothetical protein QQ045_016229 [Rhodiola kirilowii]
MVEDGETVDTSRTADSISVTIRFRPLSEREFQRGDEVAWYAYGDKIVKNACNRSTAYAFVGASQNKRAADASGKQLVLTHILKKKVHSVFEAQAKTKQPQHELEGALQALKKSQCCSPST